MEFLITLIGNAAVDPNFRKMFLKDPVDTIDRYGFRLTKSDYQLMVQVFGGLTQAERDELDKSLSLLEAKLYAKIRPPCTPLCFWSIAPPPEVRSKLPEWKETPAA